jgi:hypothetical protein
VACACHPKLHGKLRFRGLWLQASLGKRKIGGEHILTEKHWVWYHATVLSAMVGSLKEEADIQAGLGKK